MEGIQLEGPIPILLFAPTLLQTVVLKRNQLNATLDFGTNYSKQLELVDLQNNEITNYKPEANKGIQVIIFTDWQIIQCAEKQGINRVTSAKKSNLVLIFLFHK